MACLAAILLLLGPSRALAGVNAWTSSGPPGASVHRVAVAPSDSQTIYAGTAGGVFRSRDGARTWQRAGLTGQSVSSLAVSPASASTVYAAVVDVFAPVKVYRSTDGGATWSFSEISVDLSSNTIVNQLAVSPDSPSTVYAGHTWGLARSLDSGETWETLLAQEGYETRFAIDPVHTSRIYAIRTLGLYGSELLKSTDGGTTWSSSLPSTSIGFFVREVVVDPSTPSTVYAYTETTPVPPRPQGPSGLYQSTDSGATWTFLREFGGRDMEIDPFDHTMYVLQTGSIDRTSNQGASVTHSFVGLPNEAVENLVFGPAGSNTMIAAMGPGGVVKSTNGGAWWVAASVGLSNSAVDVLAVDAESPGRLYASVRGAGMFDGPGGGAWWREANGPRRGRPPSSIALDPTDRLRAFAAVDGWVHRTRTGGDSWEVVLGSHHLYVVAIAPSTPSTIYAAGFPQAPDFGVWKSSDGGDHWSELPTPLAQGDYVRCLAIDPTSPGTVYAGGPTVIKTLDGGATWAASSTGLPAGPINALRIDPANPSTLYAGTDQGVYKSLDSGGTWAPVNAGVGNATSVNALAIDPAATGTLYAGTGDAGVLRTMDGGGSWTPFNEGLADTSVLSLAIDGTGTALYAGTERAAAFSRQIRPDPAVSGIAPSSGPASGGAVVTISGSGFAAGAAVRVGGLAATNVVVQDAGTITARTPALSAGSLNDVQVTNPGGPGGTLPGGFLADFDDVPAGALFHDVVEKFLRAGGTRGCGSGGYCPGEPLTKSQVAAFLLRAAHGPGYRPPPATGAYFQDVTPATFLADWIEGAWVAGLVGSCASLPRRFCPDDRVTRADFAFNLWVVQFSGRSPGLPTGVIYRDVPASLPTAVYVEALTFQAIVSGCGNRNFCPASFVTRGEAAAFPARVFSLP